MLLGPRTRSGTGSISRLQKLSGLDWPVLLTLVFRGWGIVAGGITMLMLPFLLTPVQQGYYYTFASVLATQIFFELGLNHVLTQLTSHAAAHLTLSNDGRLEGEGRWRNALRSLLALSRKWNGIMATIFFLSLLTGGSVFFSRKGALPMADWLAVWLVLILAAALNLAFSARLAICEGMGALGQVAKLRLYQSMIGYVLLWVLLASGLGLWAVVAVPLSAAIMTAIWLRRQPMLRRLSVPDDADAKAYHDQGYTWRKDVFPLQWKIAISWASGYFIFNFLTPVVFAKQGAEAAGKLGLAMTIFTAISTIGMSWISAKVPDLAGHIARGQREALNKLFDHQAWRSVFATALCTFGFLAVLEIAGYVQPKILDRLPTFTALLLLALTTVANSGVFAMAAYIRAHKEEPLLAQSVVCAILIGAGVFEMAHFSLTATIAAYATVSIVVAPPWCYRIYKKFRQRSQ
jgi:hypothetical protein